MKEASNMEPKKSNMEKYIEARAIAEYNSNPRQYMAIGFIGSVIISAMVILGCGVICK